jgi:phage repressor protein C with HTH and peptisase S24 domain
MKDRLILFLKHLGIGQDKFEKRVGLSRGFVNKVGYSIREESLNKISATYPQLNTLWLTSGIGDMLNESEEKKEDLNYVFLLPISAQGGSLNEFIVSFKDSDCERIISPIKGADFAMQVSGDSMAPEYPSGSQILIKKINEKAFIDWGRVYVLDTVNGSVIKKVFPSEEPGKIKCVSINPDYPSYEISMSDDVLFGVYRVLLCMSIK